MMISTRGRYALRVMIDLAEHSENGLTPMKEVANRQKISLKYLEKILPDLAKNDFVVGVHGKGGGYKLTRNADEYYVLDILKATEGFFGPVACLDCNAEKCELMEVCKTRPMWNKLQSIIYDYLGSLTLSDIINKPELFK